MKNEDMLIILFGIIFIFSIVMAVSGIFPTGHAVSQETTSEVVISNYYAIEMSTNLTVGILFGTENSSTQDNVNGTGNYGPSDQSQYYISVSSDSNVNVDLAIKADGNLSTANGDLILLANETFANSTSTDLNNPALADENSLTALDQDCGKNISIGSNDYFRFWLDIPSGIAAGTYNNTIIFTGSQTS